MQEPWLNILLQQSGDFIMVVDGSGAILQLGDHFRNILEAKGIAFKSLQEKMPPDLSLVPAGGIVAFDLQPFGIVSSLFSVLHRQGEVSILLAGARKVMQTLIEELRDHRVREKTYLEKSERIHVLLDESSDPIFSFAADGTYLYINRVFADTVGRSQEEIIGKKIWDVFSKKEADKRFAMVQQVFQTGEIKTIEVRVPLPQGGEKYFFTTVKPVKDGDGKVAFVICISKEITELVLARKEIAQLRDIIPICASCKNIRNNQGDWQNIEDYLVSHSGAAFSHGLCPDCLFKLYPDYIDEKTVYKPPAE